MDGDLAPVEELVTLCAGLGALLVIDEVHAVLGPHPELAGVEPRRVGTLSKTLGALGGYVAGPGPLIERLRNRARSFIFTTATSPAVAAAALAAIRIVRWPRARSPPPATLLEKGFLVPAIRPPTVSHEARACRVTVSGVHTDDQVAGLVAALAEIPLRSDCAKSKPPRNRSCFACSPVGVDAGAFLA